MPIWKNSLNELILVDFFLRPYKKTAEPTDSAMAVLDKSTMLAVFLGDMRWGLCGVGVVWVGYGDKQAVVYYAVYGENVPETSHVKFLCYGKVSCYWVC